MTTISPFRPPHVEDAKGMDPGTLAYPALAPTHPHLGWTPAQVQAWQQKHALPPSKRPLADVLGAMEHYKVPSRGLNRIPPELFADVRTRLDAYIKPVQDIPRQFWITDPARATNPQAWSEAAQQANAMRNSYMDGARGQISEGGKNASIEAKNSGIPFDEAWKKAKKSLDGQMDAMPPAQREITIAKEVIASSGRTDTHFNALAHGADDLSRQLKMLKTGGRALGAVGAVMDGLSLTQEISTSVQTGDWHNTGQEASRVAGGWLGAAASGAVVGAVSGSIVPVIGNIGGFLVGAAAGALGYWLGSTAGQAAYQAAAQ